MDITVTIDPAVESVGIQSIAKALNVTGTDEDCRGHLAQHLRTAVANLYVRGEAIKRDEADAASAVAAAASYITIA